MTKKVLLIGGYSSDSEENPALEEFTAYMCGTLGESADVSATYLDQLIFDISEDIFDIYDSRNKTDIKLFDVIYIRGPKMRLRSPIAHYISRFCDFNKIVCVNDYSVYYPGTKFAQAIKFMEYEAPFLRTLYSLDKRLLISKAEEELGYPFVLKTNVGSHGDSNFLIRDKEQVGKILADEPETDFLAQSFCLNDRDYRLLIMQDEHLIFERQGTTDSHINNTSKGAESRLVQDVLTSDIVDKARQLSKALGLMVSGVDIMPHKETGKMVFLEINSQPQLRTGALLEQKQNLLRGMFDKF